MHRIRASAALTVWASMLYCVGRYHPVPGENEDLPPGYDLTAAELAELGSLEGVPITLEHTGISTAVALLLNTNKQVAGYSVGIVLDELCKNDIGNVPVGVCLDVTHCDTGYYVLYAIDTEEWPVLATLLPHMTGISLSHMEYGNRLVPLELSLCVKPARPGCYQVYSSADYVNALQYMRRNFSSTESMSEPSQIEQILARLPDADQKIISARFETMVMEIQKQRKEAQEAIETAKKLEKAQSSGNMQLLEWGLKNIERQLPEQVQNTFNCGSDQLMPELSSSDPEAVRRAVDRLICACSHHMMQMSSSRGATEQPVARKRPRSPSPAPAPAAAEASLPSREPTSEELLKEAMANSFGPFTTN